MASLCQGVTIVGSTGRPSLTSGDLIPLGRQLPGRRRRCGPHVVVAVAEIDLASGGVRVSRGWCSEQSWDFTHHDFGVSKKKGEQIMRKIWRFVQHKWNSKVPLGLLIQTKKGRLKIWTKQMWNLAHQDLDHWITVDLIMRNHWTSICVCVRSRAQTGGHSLVDANLVSLTI